MKKIFGFLLGLLGFAGCESESETIRGGVMYGTPYVEFEVKGIVTDDCHNTLENVEVKMAGPYFFDKWKSQITNQNGQYEFPPQRLDISDSLYVKLVASDCHDEYQNDTAIVTFMIGDFSHKKKEETWYSGTAEKTVNFTLKKKDGK